MLIRVVVVVLTHSSISVCVCVSALFISSPLGPLALPCSFWCGFFLHSQWERYYYRAWLLLLFLLHLTWVSVWLTDWLIELVSITVLETGSSSSNAWATAAAAALLRGRCLSAIFIPHHTHTHTPTVPHRGNRCQTQNTEELWRVVSNCLNCPVASTRVFDAHTLAHWQLHWNYCCCCFWKSIHIAESLSHRVGQLSSAQAEQPQPQPHEHLVLLVFASKELS